MKNLIFVLATLFIINQSVAGATEEATAEVNSACKSVAAKRKGIDVKSYVKNCEKDVIKNIASCERIAIDFRKLEGSAKTSFVTKCQKDAVKHIVTMPSWEIEDSFKL